MKTEPAIQTPGRTTSLYERTKITRGDITIFKRYEGVNAKYYFRPSAQGKRCMCKLLRTADESFKAARQILDAIDAGRFQILKQINQRQNTDATVNQLCKAYLEAPVDATHATREHNIASLLWILRTIHKVDEARLLSISKIDAALGRAWYAFQNARAQAAPDQATANSIRQSANSRFAQARSLFIARALPYYQDLGLYADCLSDFTNAFVLHKFNRLAKPEYNPPSDEIVRATLAAWLKLEDRNLFLAIGHELSFGLRKSELAQARWAWWSTREGYPVLDGEAKVKSGTAHLQVRCLDPFYHQMRERIETQGWRGKPDDYIISGTPTFRQDVIYRDVSAFLRAQGWHTNKTNHALRAYAGSQVAMRYGIYEAQIFLRHSSVKVTEESYSHFVRKFKPADPEALSCCWAS